MIQKSALLLFLLITKQAFAEDVLKKAQTLALQKDRTQAVKILVKAIKSQPAKSARLMPALEEISTMFYTENGQKLFEYAKSLFQEPTTEPMDKLQEALKLEPGNQAIELWIARLFLKQGKCAEALTGAQQSLDANPYYQPATLVKMQALVCLQKEDDLQKSTIDFKKMEMAYPVYSQVLEAQESLNKGELFTADMHLHKAEQIDKTFPEIYFWKTQVLEKEEKDIKESVKAYIKSCKALTKKDFLRYELEPRTCIEYKNFESEHKGILEQEGKKDL